MTASRGRSGEPRRPLRVALLAMAAIAAIATVAYLTLRSSPPPLEARSTPATVEQEVALGLQAALAITRQFGGLLQDGDAQRRLDSLGHSLAGALPAPRQTYPFDFHILRDDVAFHAVTLPGGQILLTDALVRALATDSLVLAVLAHQIGHQIAGHSVKQLARMRIDGGITGYDVLASYAPENPTSRNHPAVSEVISRMIRVEHTVAEEQEADSLAIEQLRLLHLQPAALSAGLQLLAKRIAASNDAPPFTTAHAISPRRLALLQDAVRRATADSAAAMSRRH